MSERDTDLCVCGHCRREHTQPPGVIDAHAYCDGYTRAFPDDDSIPDGRDVTCLCRRFRLWVEETGV